MSLDDGLQLASEVMKLVEEEVIDDTKVVLVPPYIHLASVSKRVDSSGRVSLGAQNCNENDSGAYTGEVSVEMLKSVGVEYVLVGHSERREYYKESDKLLTSKVDKALEADLIPIFCCGESLDIRESGTQKEFVCEQIKKSLFHLNENEFGKIVIAYEPIWAIGTGKTASSEQAQEMHASIRNYIAGQYGLQIADDCSILYGGSAKPSNARELFACPDVDGGLIGGASLKSRDFVDIVKSF